MSRKMCKLLSALLAVLMLFNMMTGVVIGDDDVEGYWDIDISFVDKDHNQVDQNGEYATIVPESTSHVSDVDYVVTLQIDYHNTKPLYTYGVGDVTITIKNPFYSKYCTDAQISVSLTTSARISDSSGNEVDGSGHWILDNSVNWQSQEYLTFTNAEAFSTKESFAGSIQLVFAIRSIREIASQQHWISGDAVVERFVDSCFHRTGIKNSDGTYSDVPIQAELQAFAEADGDTRPDGVTVKSDTIEYHYERKYEHPWTPYENKINKTGSAVTSPNELKGIPAEKDFDDYYWVQWDIAIDATDELMRLTSANGYFYNKDLYIFNKKLRVYDDFPSDCLVYKPDGTKLESDESGTKNGTLRYSEEFDLPYAGGDKPNGGKYPAYDTTALSNLDQSTIDRIPLDGNGYYHWYVIVGYPKDNYDPKVEEIPNTAYLQGMPINEDEYAYTKDDSASVKDFDKLEYTGELYYTSKDATSKDKKYYQHLVGLKDLNDPFTYSIFVVAIYADYPAGEHKDDDLLPYNVKAGYGMDVVIGDDYLYVTQNGIDRPMGDDEYFFAEINFPAELYNLGGVITAGKYDVELFVRYAGTKTYEKYGDTFKNGIAQNFTFDEEDKVVGYYFVIRDMKESLAGDLYFYKDSDGNTLFNFANGGRRNEFTNAVVIKNADKDIDIEGRVCNFSFLKVYKEPQDNERWNGDDIQGWVNQPENGSYVQGTDSDFALPGGITERDNDPTNHGGNVQRGGDDDPYEGRDNFMIKQVVKTRKELYLATDRDTYDPVQGGWIGTAKLGVYLGGDLKSNFSDKQLSASELELLPIEKWCVGWEIYDLLPEYMEVTSTEQEIADSIIKYYTGYTKPPMWCMSNGGTLFQKNIETGKVTSTTNSSGQTTFGNLIKNNTKVTIEKNYNNTNRTRIHIIIDLTKNPILYIDSGANKGLGGTTTNGKATNGTYYGDFQLSYDFVYRLDGYLAAESSTSTSGVTVSNTVMTGYYQREAIPNFYNANGTPGTGYEKYDWYDTTNPFLVGWTTTYSNTGTVDSIPTDDGGAHYYMISDKADWDGDGRTDDFFAASRSAMTVYLPTGSWQSVVKKVAAPDYNNGSYSTSSVNVPLNGLYTYSLTIRIGNSRLDNIILYDDIERFYQTPGFETSATESKWLGSFVSVDVLSGASKDEDNELLENLERIDIYYSDLADAQPGALYTDSETLNPQWKKYDDTVSKAKVLHLAFEFIRKADASYTMDANDVATIYITMQAPESAPDSKDYYTHNGARTSWTAADAQGNPFGSNIGLPSNTVRVYLPVDVSVEKVWDDNDNSERPDSVTVQLYRDGTAYGSSVELNDSNEWKHKWTNLERGRTWTVEEIDVPEGYRASITYDEEENEWIITNTLDVVDITVNKVWKDNSEADSHDAVQVQLYCKDEGCEYANSGESVYLSKDNGWTYTWTNLESGHNWAVKEITVLDGYNVTVTHDGNVWTITNSTGSLFPESGSYGLIVICTSAAVLGITGLTLSHKKKKRARN